VSLALCTILLLEKPLFQHCFEAQSNLTRSFEDDRESILPNESDGAIRLEWRRHLIHSYSTTVTLSGAQPPWKPNGTRTGRRTVAIGSPAKSWASRMTTSL